MDTQRLIIQMYDSFCAGGQVYDFGSVQYNFCERSGLLDIDAYKEFEEKAKQIPASQALLSMKKDKKDEWTATAKLLCLRDLFSRIRHAKQHIKDYITI